MVKAIDIMKQIKVDMVYLPSDSYVIANADKIVSRLTESGIPSYGAVKPLIIKGAMIGIVSDYFQVGQALAAKAKKILAGSKPSNIPSFRLPLKDQLIMFNPKTLESLKFKFPEEIRKKAVLAGR
jgi:putative ABC transport system substrate-binding protein